MQRSVSELEAATGEKKGGGDISGVRYLSLYILSLWCIVIYLSLYILWYMVRSLSIVHAVVHHT